MDKLKSAKFKLRLLPCMIFTGLVFPIVHIYSYTLPMSQYIWTSEEDTTVLYDVFNHCKQTLIVICAVCAILTLGFLLITAQIKIKRTKLYIPIGIYTAMALLSFITSKYKTVAWDGVRYEGTLTILCYIIMLFYTIQVLCSLSDIKYLLVSMFPGLVVSGIIGFSQFIGHDILMTDFGKSILTMGTDISKDSIEPQFLQGQVYQTVSNMNYVSMYIVLLFPVIISIIILGIKKSEKKLTISACVILALMIISFIGAKSTSGLVGIGAQLFVFAIILLAMSKPTKFKIPMICAVCILTLILGCFALKYEYGKSVDDINIGYIVTTDDNIKVLIDGEELEIKYDKNADQFSLSDSDGKSIDVFCFEDEDGIYQVDNINFAGKVRVIPFKQDGSMYIALDFHRDHFLFRYADDGVKYINPAGNEEILDKVEKRGFAGHYAFGSGRGYIWAATIPLLKSHVLFGSGAGTFIYEFPQSDYAGKFTGGYVGTIVDKPHNMFLQMFVTTGGISLIAFLLMSGCVIFLSIKHLKEKKSENSIRILTVALILGIFGFLVTGMFNDTNISVMPMFYSLLAILEVIVFMV